jgi:hypothetical protein
VSGVYSGYSKLGPNSEFARGRPIPALMCVVRVATVEIGAAFVAYRCHSLSEKRLINGTLGGQEGVVFSGAVTNSALDGPLIRASRDVGSSRNVSGQWTAAG